MNKSLILILARYPTDLTDTEWAVLAPLIPAAKAGGRPVAGPELATCARW
jgi:transposase